MRSFRICFVVLVFQFILITAHASDFYRASQTIYGGQGNGSSLAPQLSADGMVVAFYSTSSNLIPTPVSRSNIFVHDRRAGTVEPINVSSNGEFGNGGISWLFSISADGRFIAFTSSSTNLVEDDNNGWNDVFVHDRQNGTTEIVSLSSSGDSANSYSGRPSISSDGRYISFNSNANNLVDNDNNGISDVFVHDRLTGLTELVSISNSGQISQGVRGSFTSSISADGRFVAFESSASNLVESNSNGFQNVYVRDRILGTTEIINISSRGTSANAGGVDSSISSDGRFVTFSSNADNLVSGDYNGKPDVFIHDRDLGTTKVISFPNGTPESQGASTYPSISADGNFVSFLSDASNLVPGDVNNEADFFVYDRVKDLIKRIKYPMNQDRDGPRDVRSSISADGRVIAFDSIFSWEESDTNGVRDVYLTENPFNASNSIELVGKPTIDRSVETGMFIWKDLNGRISVVVAAGDPAQNGSNTHFAGTIKSDQEIFSLLKYSIEASDSLTRSTTTQINFDLIAKSPWEDRFTFKSDNAKSICINLTEFEGGLYLGPDKVKVQPPYDLVRLDGCEAPPVIVGEPVIDATSQTGIYVWQDSSETTYVKFLAGIDNQIDRFTGTIIGATQIRNLASVAGITEPFVSRDRLVQIGLNQLEFDLFTRRINASTNRLDFDLFSFANQADKQLCLYLKNLPGKLFIGPDKVEVQPPYDINLLSQCNLARIPVDGKPVIDRSIDRGIFIWKNESDKWQIELLAGEGSVSRTIQIVSRDNGIEKYRPFSIESSDSVLYNSHQISANLRVWSPNYDAFEFVAVPASQACFEVTNTGGYPIYLGPHRIKMNNGFDLSTQRSCQYLFP